MTYCGFIACAAGMKPHRHNLDGIAVDIIDAVEEAAAMVVVNSEERHSKLEREVARLSGLVARIGKERNAALRERDRLRQWLKDISDPVSALRRSAEAKGYELNGAAAVSLSENANHLKQMALTALAGGSE